MNTELSTVDIAGLREGLHRVQHFNLFPWRATGPNSDIVAGNPDVEGNPLDYEAGRQLAAAAVNALPVLLAIAETTLPARPDGSPPGEAHAHTDTPRTLAAMTGEVDALNTAKGWRDEDMSFGDRVALLTEELGEMVSAWRDYRMTEATRADGKPLDVASEMADLFIRLLDMCAVYDVDLAAQFTRKMAYNWTRPYQHGGRTMTGDKPTPTTPADPACTDTRPDHDGPVDRVVVYRSRLSGNETDRSDLLCTGHAMTRVFAWNAGQGATLAVVAELHQLATA